MDEERFLMAIATAEEFPELRAWLSEHAWSLVPSHVPTEELSDEARRSASGRYAEHVHYDARRPYWIVRDMHDNGHIVGTAGVTCHDDTAYLHGAIVQEDRRRRGIGRALLRERLAYAKTRGCRFAEVRIEPHRTASLANCTAAGFVRAERTTPENPRYILTIT